MSGPEAQITVLNLPDITVPPPQSTESKRCTLYINLILLAGMAFLLLSDERDVFSIFRSKNGGLFTRDPLLDDDVLDINKTYHLLHREGDVVMPGRFPRLGSKEFRKTCSWTAMPRNAHRNCTIFMTPRQEGHEGISYWISEVVMSYMLARMGHCQLYIDYGPSVAIHDVLIPASGFVRPEDILSPLLDDWKVPERFVCRGEDKCITERFVANFPPDGIYNKPPQMLKGSGDDKVDIAPIPRYRFAFQYDTGRLFSDDYKDTAIVLPGFQVETGMACSMGNLFHLSPNASKYDAMGRLFTEILPMVRSNPTLALYIRTGHAEHLAKNKNATVDHKMPNQDEIVDASVKTALELERRYLAGELELGYKGKSAKPLPRNEISTFTWLVISDSSQVKEDVVKKYNEKSLDGVGGGGNRRQLQNNIYAPSKQSVVNGKIGLTMKEAAKSKPKMEVHVGGTKIQKPEKTDEERKEEVANAQIIRRVLTTSTRGAHTRLQDGVSTADFAEALIDYYLIGESDAVIASNIYSFGTTAALRTARPIYDPMKLIAGEEASLKPLKVVYEGSPKSLAGGVENGVLQVLENLCKKKPKFSGTIGLQGRQYTIDCTQAHRRLRSGEMRYANFIVTALEGESSCTSLCIL